MDIVCSSMGMEAVISRAEGESFIVIGWSSVLWEGAQAEMVESSEVMMRGEMYFCVQVSVDMLREREAVSRHHSFEMVGRWRRDR